MSAPVPEQESALKQEASLKYAQGWTRVQRPASARLFAKHHRRLPTPAAMSSAIQPHGTLDCGMREPPWRRKSAPAGFEGDVAIVELRARLALSPDRIPEPMPRRASGITWGVAGRLTCVAALAAGGAFALLWLNAPRGEGPGRPYDAVAQPASPDLQVAVSLKGDLARAPLPATLPPWTGDLLSWPVAGNGSHPARDSTTSAAVPAVDPEMQGGERGPGETRMSPEASKPAAPAEPAAGRDEIAALVARGAKYFAAGDIAAARLMLRPAALAGNSVAALALGETYDPVVLKRLGVIGFPGDLAEARDWYRRAAELGSTEAPRRLDQLAGLDR